MIIAALIVAGIAVLVIVVLFVVMLVSGSRKEKPPEQIETMSGRIVVNKKGADVRTGTLGSGSLFVGYNQMQMGTAVTGDAGQMMYRKEVPMLILKECSGGQVWKCFLENEVFLGRKSDPGGRPSVVLNFSGISKQHCSVYLSGKDVMVMDRNSTNGTYINGYRLNVPGRLSTGDVLSLGSIRFKVMLNG